MKSPKEEKKKDKRKRNFCKLFFSNFDFSSKLLNEDTEPKILHFEDNRGDFISQSEMVERNLDYLKILIEDQDEFIGYEFRGNPGYYSEDYYRDIYEL